MSPPWVLAPGVAVCPAGGEALLAGAGEINLVVPGEVHTGHPALYLQPELVRDVARQRGRDAEGLPFFQAGDFLEECWRQRPALNELATMVELSPYQLLRAFMRQFGLPPHAYLIQRQVREARRLLDQGTAIADAAFAAGFADQSHLHRHFKRIWGVTPGQYRNFVQEHHGWRR